VGVLVGGRVAVGQRVSVARGVTGVLVGQRVSVGRVVTVGQRVLVAARWVLEPIAGAVRINASGIASNPPSSNFDNQGFISALLSRG
jgi:UDP-3-O-[3-hydroxymyristoyl] glucosamine N-acyltransferase